MPIAYWSDADAATLDALVRAHPALSAPHLHALLPTDLRDRYSVTSVKSRLQRLGLASALARHLHAGPPPAPPPVPPPPPTPLEQVQTERLRQRTSVAESDARAIKAEAAQKLDLLEAMRGELERRPAITAPAPHPDTRAYDEVDIVLFCSDLHVGQHYDILDSGGLGAYDIDAYVTRAQRYAAVIAQYVDIYRRSFRLNRCTLIMGGDLVDGRTIHPGHEIQSEHIATQLIVGPEVFSRYVVAPLAALFTQMELFTAPGNHGRVGNKGALHRVKDNLDTVFYHYMSVHSRELRNVRFHPAGQWYVDLTIRGHRFFAAHGDNFKSWAGVPFYGMTRNKGRMEGISNDMIDVIMTGHHHSPATFHVNHGQVVSNGSWVGAGEFGTWLGMAGPPVQKMLVVHDDFPIMAAHDIYLVKPKDCLTHTPIDLDTLTFPWEAT